MDCFLLYLCKLRFTYEFDFFLFFGRYDVQINYICFSLKKNKPKIDSWQKTVCLHVYSLEFHWQISTQWYVLWTLDMIHFFSRLFFMLASFYIISTHANFIFFCLLVFIHRINILYFQSTHIVVGDGLLLRRVVNKITTWTHPHCVRVNNFCNFNFLFILLRCVIHFTNYDRDSSTQCVFLFHLNWSALETSK